MAEQLQPVKFIDRGTGELLALIAFNPVGPDITGHITGMGDVGQYDTDWMLGFISTTGLPSVAFINNQLRPSLERVCFPDRVESLHVITPLRIITACQLRGLVRAGAIERIRQNKKWQLDLGRMEG